MRNVISKTGPVILLSVAMWLSLAGLLSTANRVEAACTYTNTPAGRTNGYGISTGTVSVATSSGCTWAVVNTNTAWITIASGGSGTGSGTVTYTLTANPSPNDRSSVLTIAGQPFNLTQRGFPCTFSISPMSRTNGNGATTGIVTLTPNSNQCAWAVSTTNSWIHITTSTSGTGTTNVGLSMDANPSSLQRTGWVMMADQVFTEIQRGAPCNYSISPTTRNHGHGAATNSVTITVADDCPWTVVNNNAWINISPTNGSGSNSVVYTVEANPTGLMRTGLLVIANQLFTLIQTNTPCTFTLAPTSGTHSAAMETGLVSVTTLVGCDWAVATTNSNWITIASNPNNTGTGSVIYVVAPNLSSMSRTGLITIDSKSFILTQQGNGCVYKLSATLRTHGYTGTTTGQVAVTTSNGCSWTAVASTNWITITAGASGTGSNNFNYTVDPNPTPYERTGLVQVVDQVLTIVQHGFPCTFSLSPPSTARGQGGGTGTVNLIVSSNLCPWTVSTTNDWISITPPLTGAGSTNIGYSVDPNPTAFERIGQILIADQFFSVTQHSVTCTFSLSPTNRNHGYGTATNTVALNASSNACPWTIVNTNDWITITSGTNGFGDTNVSYTVDGNPNPMGRTGLVMIADQVFVLGQKPVTCSYSLSATNRNHGYGAATNQVTVTTSGGCTWDVVNTNSWITIVAGSNGIGSNIVVYTVDANTNTVGRSGNLVIVDQVLTLNQAAAACAFALSPDSGVHGYGAGTGLVTVATSDGCTWTATTTNTWISITSNPNGSGAGSAAYSVTPNLGPTNRVGGIAIDSQFFTITQFGTNCGYVLSAASRTHGYAATTNTVNVNTSSNCAWTVVNTNPWVTINSGANGTGTGTVTYAVLVNASFNDRAGVLLIGGQPFNLTQRGYACADSISPTNRPHGYTASAGTISLTTSSNTCPWDVVDTNGWITITSPTNGTGNATISYTVDANPSIDPRVGVVMIAAQPLIVTQQGFPCNLKLTPTNRVHGFGTATNNIGVTNSTSACTWTVVNTNDWINITSPGNGMGNSVVSYWVSPNFSSNTRTGVVMIGDQTVTLAQLAATNLSLSATALLPGAQLQLSLAGGPGGVWELHASSNLVQWAKIASLTNITGRMVFTDTLPAGAGRRFYRAFQPAPTNSLIAPTATLQIQSPLRLALVGSANGVWELQTSSDLKKWSTLATLTNTTGRVDFTNSISTNSDTLFYRALQQ